MDAYAAGMEPQLSGELIRSGRAVQGRKVGKQPRPRWLSQHVTRTV